MEGPYSGAPGRKISKEGQPPTIGAGRLSMEGASPGTSGRKVSKEEAPRNVSSRRGSLDMQRPSAERSPRGLKRNSVAPDMGRPR